MTPRRSPAADAATYRVKVLEESEFWNDWTWARLLGGGELHGLPYEVEVDDPALPVICTMTVTVEHGRLVCTALELTRRADGAAITGAFLRRIPVGAYLAASLIAHPHYDVAVRGDDQDGAFEMSSRRQRQLAAGMQSEDTLTQVVATYRHYLQQGIVRGARQAVVDELGLSPGHVSRLLTRARREHLLLPTEIGAGGARTHKPAAKQATPQKKRTR